MKANNDDVWGVYIMLAILLMLVLAINGGLFTGTVLYSAYKASENERIASFAEKLWHPPLSS